MEPSAISSLCKAQRAYFETGAPCAVPARKAALAALERALKENEAMLLAALQQDLGKPAAEGYFSELALVMDLSLIHISPNPSFAKARAAARPMPPAAPVIITFLLFTLILKNL